MRCRLKASQLPHRFTASTLQPSSFPKPAEPGIGKDVTRAVSGPARRIHFAVRLHDWITIAHLAATLSKITNQFLARIELRARRLVTIEVADQTNAKCNVVQIVAVDVTAIDLSSPAVSNLDLPVAGGRSVADHKMISETVLHAPDTPVIIIEDSSIPLSRAAVMHNDVLPAFPRDRCPIDRASHGCGQILITGAAAARPDTEKSGPETARPVVTIFFDR